ncbi:MAG: nitrous oxide reductase accessory protein NosL [Alphaproteobacteria bacterium]
MRSQFLAVAAASVLAACSSDQQIALPTAVALTGDDLGHFCQMTVVDHAGPKAQVHLAGADHPLFFTQVRDALAYDRMPEETAEVTAIFVNDMAVAKSWSEPGVDNWIDIKTAVFVGGSTQRGGMGAPELVPFSTHDAAQAFASEFGGQVINFTAIDDEMVLTPVEVEHRPSADDPPAHEHDASGHAGMEMPS